MTTATTRALTVRQPWASLISLHAKTLETRATPTKFRGPVLIHSAQGVEHFKAKTTTDIGKYSVERDAGGLLLRGPISHPYRLPLGAVVAIVDLVDCLPIIDNQGGGDDTGALVIRIEDDNTVSTFGDLSAETVTEQLPYGDFGVGRYCWVMENVRPVKDVTVKGKLGLWTPTAELVKEVLDAVR